MRVSLVQTPVALVRVVEGKVSWGVMQGPGENQEWDLVELQNGKGLQVLYLGSC